MDKKSFLESASGAILERVDLALAGVFDNIMDPNTAPEKKRSLTIVAEFLPTESRDFVKYMVTIKPPKLEPSRSITGMLGTHVDEEGGVVLNELTAEIPGQCNLLGDEESEANVIHLKRA